MAIEMPDVQYARSGDVVIAYQVVGAGPVDIVFVRGTLADLLAAWDQPLFIAHVNGLARSGRVLLFDKRGSGLSDPVRQVPTLETRMDDIRAVMDAAGSERALLWAAHEGTRIALLFAATYPERTAALVLYDPTARGLWAPDYPWAADEDEWRRELRTIGERWGDRKYLSERALRRGLGLEIRAGLHTGECERMNGKLGGIAVPTGARAASLAAPRRGARLPDGERSRRGVGDRVRRARRARAEGSSGRMALVRCRRCVTR